MTRSHLKILTCTAAVAAGLLGGCHDDHGSGSTPPSTGQTENFSSFATQTFKADASSQPVSLDNITLVYDVNDDPTAFAALLM